MMTEDETFTDDTLHKVAVAMREADIEDNKIETAITYMQDYGILFRERVAPTLFD